MFKQYFFLVCLITFNSQVHASSAPTPPWEDIHPSQEMAVRHLIAHFDREHEDNKDNPSSQWLAYNHLTQRLNDFYTYSPSLFVAEHLHKAYLFNADEEGASKWQKVIESYELPQEESALDDPTDYYINALRNYVSNGDTDVRTLELLAQSIGLAEPSENETLEMPPQSLEHPEEESQDEDDYPLPPSKAAPAA